ncbi:MAG: hypothetical protein WC002_03015 [Candidatus Muiribacteriota bacterium]
MKKFIYKYERLLNIREIEEKREYAILTKIRNQVKLKEEEQINKKEEINITENTIKNFDKFTIEELKYFAALLSEQNKELEKIIVEKRDLIKKEKEQEKKVVEISRAKKTLEKLKEKHRIIFNKEEEKKLNKFLDELGTQKFLNNRERI